MHVLLGGGFLNPFRILPPGRTSIETSGPQQAVMALLLKNVSAPTCDPAASKN